MDSLEVNVSFPDYIEEYRGLVNLGGGGVYDDKIDFSSWWSSLDAKLAVTGSINLVDVMDTD